MLKTIRTNFDRQEARRDRRYPLPPIAMTLAEIDYTTVNWSLGGFLLDGGPDVAVGTVLAGRVQLPGGSVPHAIAAELVRRDASDGSTAFRFVDSPAALVDALDRLAARRMQGRRE